MKWIDYLFYDAVTGEEFLVEVQDCYLSYKEAFNIAHENFEEPRLITTMSDTEGEMLGLDTYWKENKNVWYYL